MTTAAPNNQLGRQHAAAALGLQKTAFWQRLIGPAAVGASAFQGGASDPQNAFHGAASAGLSSAASLGAGAAGGAIGGAIGTAIFPVVGTAIGSTAGWMLGSMLGDKYLSPMISKAIPRRTQMQFRPQIQGLPMVPGVKAADYKENSRGEDCGPDEDHDGKISPEELHQHFDHDSDGTVTMQDYARHIALHQAHPEWLAQEMAELVSQYEGVPVQTHGYNSGHEDKMAAEGTATKRDPKKWAAAKAQAKAKMGGKHSARAMQLAVQIYKKKGGRYEGPKPSAAANKMRKWTKQDWQTRPGTDEKAERDDGRTARYLPKSKWESLSKEEQKATDRKKLEGKGQYVENTEKAKVKEALQKIASRLKNPKGGLTAAGREHFKRTEGANLKPGVKNVSKKGDAEKKRWARWAMRFYTNPRGPMKNEQGKPTRLALMANAWGTKVPGTRAEAQAIAARARKMMEGIKAREKKSYDMGSTLQAGLTGALPMAAMGAMSAHPGQRLHDAAVQAIVGAVPSMAFDAYNQLTTTREPAWEPLTRAAYLHTPEEYQPYMMPSGYRGPMR
jgi:hypothetical protein